MTNNTFIELHAGLKLLKTKLFNAKLKLKNEEKKNDEYRELVNGLTRSGIFWSPVCKKYMDSNNRLADCKDVVNNLESAIYKMSAAIEDLELISDLLH